VKYRIKFRELSGWCLVDCSIRRLYRETISKTPALLDTQSLKEEKDLSFAIQSLLETKKKKTHRNEKANWKLNSKSNLSITT